jgi:hypothetical protein
MLTFARWKPLPWQNAASPSWSVERLLCRDACARAEALHIAKSEGCMAMDRTWIAAAVAAVAFVGLATAQTD